MGRMEPLASAAFGREGRGVFYVADAPCGGRNIFRQRKGLRGRGESSLGASAEAKSSVIRGKQERLFPLPFTRNLFLVGGFVRLRADEVLSPRGKVPKGRRGRPKGACGVAAPGPPVAKEQCTASLAGARPAGFTSVPGRATVAFGAADPSPGVWAPVYPWSGGKEPPR